MSWLHGTALVWIFPEAGAASRGGQLLKLSGMQAQSYRNGEGAKRCLVRRAIPKAFFCLLGGLEGLESRQLRVDLHPGPPKP